MATSCFSVVLGHERVSGQKLLGPRALCNEPAAAGEYIRQTREQVRTFFRPRIECGIQLSISNMPLDFAVRRTDR